MSDFDPVRILDVLARHGVDFVVIGGFAAELYRAPIPGTQDIDVTPNTSMPNLARLSTALDDLGARVRSHAVPEGLPFSHDAASLGRTSVWNLTTPAGEFDISFYPSGTDGYDDLAANAVMVEVGGHNVAVAALADVVRSKEAAGRPKDLNTLATLRQWVEVLRASTLDDLRSEAAQVLRQRAGKKGN